MTWVSVWCKEFSVDFGHVFLSPIEEQGCSSGSSESGLSGDADNKDNADNVDNAENSDNICRQ